LIKSSEFCKFSGIFFLYFHRKIAELIAAESFPIEDGSSNNNKRGHFLILLR